MRTKVFALMSLLLMVATLFSCEQKQPAENLSAEIYGLEVSGSSVIFTIIPTNDVETYSYSVTAAGSTTPAKEEAFTDALPREITISELEQNTEYEIIVTVAAGNSTNTVNKKFVTVENAFERYVLFTKFTGSWCSNCPNMTSQLDRLQKDMGERLVIVAMHGNDGDLTLDTEMNIIQPAFGITGYPTGLVNYYVTTIASYSQIEAAILKSEKEAPCVSNVDITAAINNGNIEITSEMEFREAGKYRYCAVVTEDNISRPGTVGSNDGMYHHVARAFATNVMGDFVNETGNVGADEKITINDTIALDGSWNQNNLNVVVYILKENMDGEFHVNNVRTVKL